MNIILAETAGYCFGVNMAINIVYDNIKNTNKPLYTLGPIIHNSQVVEELEDKGVNVINNVEEIKCREARLIIRSHGVSKRVYDIIKDYDVELEDATCPYVKKIHRIVEEKYSQGYTIIIIGDPKHPEVVGINGWCDDSAIVINSAEDIKLDKIEKVCVVAQTTINREIWDEITKIIKNNCTYVIFFDTICSATNLRQKEAEKIAEKVEIMLVIGGKHSSNTQKLYKICKEHCKETYHVETQSDLPDNILYSGKTIGITAGASTPSWIIKEVIHKMYENEKMQEGTYEMNFEQAFEEQLLLTLHTGDIVKGTVISITNNEVYVDLGFKSDGVLSIDEFDDSEDLGVKIGEEIEVFVVRVNDGEGNVVLSKKKIDSIKGWQEVEAAFENQAILSGKVVDIVNGGVIVSYKGVRVFVPASQLSDRFISDLNEYRNQIIKFKIIDYGTDKRRKKVVGSVKILLQEEKVEKLAEFWSEAEVGKKYTGTIKKLASFGAFVDLGAIDGLIHISELSWTKIKHPSEILKEGDIVEVYILEFDKDNKKISLGFKKAEDNPWDNINEKFNVGDVVKCKVVRLVPFGAFVELTTGLDGLIHISQISDKRIGKPSDVLSVGQEIEAKISDINLENKKISLSIRELLPETETETEIDNDVKAEYKEESNVTMGDAIKDKLNNLEYAIPEEVVATEEVVEPEVEPDTEK